MASYAGAITKFNPYVQQIPTDAFSRVGMYKQQQYEAGIQRVQGTIDGIAGLDIANEGGRAYLRDRVNELTNTLNKYNQVDFSDPNAVNQLTSLAAPLYQDANIEADVINTGVYRNWAKKAGEAYQSGKMELGQYARETQDAATWLNSKVAGSQYTGRSNPNLSTKKDIMDRIVKYKKDAMEKSEFVTDEKYDPTRPYYVKTTDKHYDEAGFNNYIMNNVLSSSDREMLMNEHWYENQGRNPESMQLEDINNYRGIIKNNKSQIEYLSAMALTATGDKKKEYEQTIADLTNYNEQLGGPDGKISYLESLNLDDPKNVDVFHRDLAENRFMSSLGIFLDKTYNQEYVKNEQWFTEQAEAARAAAKAAADAGKKKSADEVIGEVSAFSPVQAGTPPTEVSAEVIRNGYQMANEVIQDNMNKLIGTMKTEGFDMDQFIQGYDIGHTKDGSEISIPIFREGKKEQFYKLFAGLNFAYEKEGDKAHIDKSDFTDWVKKNIAGYNDDDPNSRFTLADKQVSDALNTLKGTSALLPKMEKLFNNKDFLVRMGEMDKALYHKKEMANVYRAALIKSQALSSSELKALDAMSDEDLMSSNQVLNKAEVAKEHPNSVMDYDVEKQSDGTYAIVQKEYEKDNSTLGHVKNALTNYLTIPQYLGIAPGFHMAKGKLKEKKIISGNYKSESEAEKGINSGLLSPKGSISKSALEKADEYIKSNFSYVQENINTSVQNLKNDKDAYQAVKDSIQLYMQQSGGIAGNKDIVIDNGAIDPGAIAGISNVEVLGASINNTTDIFNPNPVYEISFEYETPDEKGKMQKHTGSGKISMKSFLAANPNYSGMKYSKYFAPLIYAQDDAYERIKSAANSLAGADSYAKRENIEPEYRRVNQQGQQQYAVDDPQGSTASGRSTTGREIQWTTIPITKGNETTMVSYKILSLGANGDGGRGSGLYDKNFQGNLKAEGNTKGIQFKSGAYYIQMKVPASDGKPRIITLKMPDGTPKAFSSPSEALYTFRNSILENPAITMEDINPNTNQPNYLTTNGYTLRGLFNTQLAYNGYSTLDPVKIKDAFGKEQTIYQAKQLQAAN